jgi:hypothetical protein
MPALSFTRPFPPFSPFHFFFFSLSRGKRAAGRSIALFLERTSVVAGLLQICAKTREVDGHAAGGQALNLPLDIVQPLQPARAVLHNKEREREKKRKRKKNKSATGSAKR